MFIIFLSLFLGQTTPQEVSTCKSKFDLIFLIDGSASIGYDYVKQLNLINYVVNYFGGVSQDVHAAVVVIGTKSSVEIRLNDYIEADKFKEAVEKVNISSMSVKE